MDLDTFGKKKKKKKKDRAGGDADGDDMNDVENKENGKFIINRTRYNISKMSETYHILRK